MVTCLTADVWPLCDPSMAVDWCADAEVAGLVLNVRGKYEALEQAPFSVWSACMYRVKRFLLALASKLDR